MGGVSCVLAVMITTSSRVGRSWSIDVTASISTTSLPEAAPTLAGLADRGCVWRTGDEHDIGAALS